MFSRLFPRQIDNAYRGSRLAIALFTLFVLMKAIISINSLANTRSVATGADAIPLESYGEGGAAAVLSLFALHSLGQLMLVLLSALVLVRYRAMIPLMFLLLLVEHVGRRMLLLAYPIARSEGPPIGLYINLGLLALLVLGLALSLLERRRAAKEART